MLKIREAKSAIREFPLIEIGVPNSVGNIYTDASAKKIFEILEEKKYFTGELVNEFFDNGEYITELEEASHIIDHLFIEDNFIVAVIRFRKTKRGDEALKIFSDGLATFRPTIRGNVTAETREINVIDVVGIDLLPITDRLMPKDISWISIG